MTDTPTGETASAAPSNEPSTTTAPPQVNSSVDVEAAKREAEQARIRANQLQNQLDKIQKEQEAAQQKQLEEKEEFKTLYEQTQSRLKEIEETQSAQERAKELSAATEEVFKAYPTNVVELAKTAGLSLSDDSEAAQASLKEKLDAFQKQVGSSTPRPSANNPHTPAPAEPARAELLGRMKAGDATATSEFIKNLPAVQRMKEIANGA